jgi:Variant SH3 domain
MRYRIISPHQSHYPDPIRFETGDRLKLGRRDDRYPGWVWVIVPSGNEGWAPESLIQIDSPDEGTALANYNARELDTTIGELVTSTRELHGWLWAQNEHGQAGWIPKETATPIPETPADS